MKSLTTMSLSQLLHGMVSVAAEADCIFQRLIIDSRLVTHGDVFLACIGQSSDGRHYIDQAIQQGAVAVLWDSDRTTIPIPLTWRVSSAGQRIPCVAVAHLTQLVGVLADRFYHGPSKSMFMVGVTGTNGKTSTTQFIAQALAGQMACGVIGTLGWGYPGKLQESSHTTPDGVTTQQWLAHLRDEGAKMVAMEVSSHALDQARLNGVTFDCAVFTNLTHDHLDYHKDMQRYAQAKQKLFAWPGLRMAVINIDDEHGKTIRQVMSPHVKVLTYGMTLSEPRPDIFADQIEFTSHGCRFVVHTEQGECNVALPVYGRFNISNALAALGVLLHSGLDLNTAVLALGRIKPVTGRMQMLEAKQHATVVVDYAHTPDALQQALAALREHVKGKLWCVFGCGGNRDAAKRPLMGAIAEQYADRVVITSDNPRHEDALQIIQEIKNGLRHSGSASVEADRALAIHFALANAAHNDIILIAGKGHETYQQIGERKLPFNDAQIVRDYLSGVKDDVK